jgi:hypothetical protein
MSTDTTRAALLADLADSCAACDRAYCGLADVIVALPPREWSEPRLQLAYRMARRMGRYGNLALDRLDALAATPEAASQGEAERHDPKTMCLSCLGTGVEPKRELGPCRQAERQRADLVQGEAERRAGEWQPIETLTLRGPEHRVLFRGVSRGRSFSHAAVVDGWVDSRGEPVHCYSYKLTITHWRPLHSPPGAKP